MYCILVIHIYFALGKADLVCQWERIIALDSTFFLKNKCLLRQYFCTWMICQIKMKKHTVLKLYANNICVLFSLPPSPPPQDWIKFIHFFLWVHFPNLFLHCYCSFLIYMYVYIFSLKFSIVLKKIILNNVIV